VTTKTAASGHTTISALSYDDFLTAFLALPQQYRPLASWIISSAVEAQAMKLKNEFGFPTLIQRQEPYLEEVLH